jgi:hypothetical protein
MKCSRSLGLGAALVLLLGLIGLAPQARAAQPQTVAFQIPPPRDGISWFDAESGPMEGYLTAAAASSGLPVTFSIATGSAEVCRIIGTFDSSGEATSVAVKLLEPGTCTILADQAGNDEYLPAEQAAQSVLVKKAHTTLTKLRQAKRFLGASTFRATLLRPYHVSSFLTGIEGFPGQVVTFSVAGKDVCSGITNADGVATCTARLTPADTARMRFTAKYAGNDRWESASRTATFGLG